MGLMKTALENAEKRAEQGPENTLNRSTAQPENTLNRPNRVDQGRFAPGNSGNPGGRPRKTDGEKLFLRETGLRALHVLAELMEGEDDELRFKAAKDLADRAYGKPAQSIDLTTVDLTPERLPEPMKVLTDEQLSQLQAMQDAMKAALKQ